MIYLSCIERDHRDHWYIWTTDINLATSLVFETKQLPDYHAYWNGVPKWEWHAKDDYYKTARMAKSHLEKHKHDRRWREIKRRLQAQKDNYESKED